MRCMTWRAMSARPRLPHDVAVRVHVTQLQMHRRRLAQSRLLGRSAHARRAPAAKGLHLSTSQLNVSTFVGYVGWFQGQSRLRLI